MAEWQINVLIPGRKATSGHSAMRGGAQWKNIAAISMQQRSYIGDAQIFFPKIQEAAQKSRRQKGYMKIDQYWGATEIGRRPKIFSRQGDLSSGIL